MEESFKKLGFSFLPIPEELMRSKALSFGAKFLFGIIAKANKENVKWSVNYLAKRMECSRREVIRRIQELKENNLIIVKQRKGKVNEYSINFQLISLIQTPDENSDDHLVTGDNISHRSSDHSGHRSSDHSGHPNKEYSLKKTIKEININSFDDFLKAKEILLKGMAMADHKTRTFIQEQVARVQRQIRAGKRPEI